MPDNVTVPNTAFVAFSALSDPLHLRFRMPKSTHLPPELLELIVSHITLEHDLLSLALTCSQLCGTIIPRHLHYRSIRCSILEGFRLWKLFSRDRDLARNVRRLEVEQIFHVPGSGTASSFEWRRAVIPEIIGMYSDSDGHKKNEADSSSAFEQQLRPPGQPRGDYYAKGPLNFNRGMQKVAGPEEWQCDPGDDEDVFERKCEGVFVLALRNMVSLESFQWGPSHHDWYCDAGVRYDPGSGSGAGSVTGAAPDQVENIWTTLARMPLLTSLNVTYWRQETGFDVLHSNVCNVSHHTCCNLIHVVFSKMWNLRSLRDFRFYTRAHDHGQSVPIVAKLEKLIEGCPNLEVSRTPSGSAKQTKMEPITLQTLSLDFICSDTYNSPLFTSFNTLLRKAHWPYLRRLKLRGLWTSSEAVIAFLEAHAGHIEDLVFDEAIGMHVQLSRRPLFRLQNNTVFPRLRRLEAPMPWISAILGSPPPSIDSPDEGEKSTIPGPALVTLRGLDFRPHQRESSISVLTRFGAQLTELRVEAVNVATLDDLHMIASHAPGLEHLDLPEVSRHYSVSSTSTSPVSNSALSVYSYLDS